MCWTSLRRDGPQHEIALVCPYSSAGLAAWPQRQPTSFRSTRSRIVQIGGIIGYVLGVPTGLALAWLLARAITRTIWSVPMPPLSIYGDFVNLPPEAKAAGGLKLKAGGTEPSMAARAQRTILDRTHDGERPTR